MTALWLVVALTGAAPRLECALVIPNPGDILLSGYSVVHDATHGVTIVSRLRSETVDQLFGGELARLVVAGSTSLEGRSSMLRLPLASGELTYVALRDGRPTTETVIDPSALTVEVAGRPTADGMALRLTFNVVQLAGQEKIRDLDDQPVGMPTFAHRMVAVNTTLGFDQPTLVLLQSAADLRVGDRDIEVTFRRRVGANTIETMGPLLGVVLRLVPPGGEPQYQTVEPPLAAPGMIRVVGDVNRPGSLVFQTGQRASEILLQAEVRGEPARVTVVRQRSDGTIARLELPTVPTVDGRADLALQERDTLIVETAKNAADVVAERTEAADSGARVTEQEGAMRRRPLEARTAAADSALTGPVPAQRFERAMPVEELRSVAPAAAVATAASVALRGRIQRGKSERELLLCGTLVSPDGLIVTAPAATLDGVATLRAQLEDGTELPCERVAVDDTGALLALRIQGEHLPAVELAESDPPVGTPLILIGHPYGLLRSLTVTFVGGPRRQLRAAPGAALQLDGSLALGNSGGPVVDLNGRLVGIAYGTLKTEEAGPPISFAVPYDTVAAFLAKLRPH